MWSSSSASTKRDLLDGLVARRPHPHGAVPELPGVRDLVADHAREDSVAKQPRGVVRKPRREGERVRTTRTKLDLEHVPIMTAAGDTLTE